MKTSDFAELLLLGAIWGASFMLMKEAVPAFGVFALVEIRALGATLCLLPLVLLKKQGGDLIRYWPKLFVVGLVNTAIPFCLFNYSLLHLNAGLGAILNATAPMFGVLVAYLYLRESIGWLGIGGIGLGFAGVVVITVGQTHVQGDGLASALPVLAALAATLCYGIAASYLKRHLSQAKPFAIAAGSQIFTAIILAPFALYHLPEVMPSSSAWISGLTLAFLCTGLAYVMYFDLIAKIGASRSMTVGYLVPLFGIFWGVVILDEVLSLSSIFGGSMILLGVMMATNAWAIFKRLLPGKKSASL
ncbi:DMT family transporter [Glaciecola siphonariae]|uniref:DMT family transporter n=1 Tax=Glaciecola siphonariae TaxID=521012 RepID=A0ABV9LSC1_9ALTE